jgi:hypothetical protein
MREMSDTSDTAPGLVSDTSDTSRRGARVARALWIAWAVIVWNVVFDHVIVMAGRGVVAAAGVAATAAPLNIDQFMRPALARGLWIATAAAAAIVIVGLTSVQLARNR